MADINVTLGLDDSQYTNKLKAAETTAISFGNKTSASLANIKSGMDKISSGVEGVNSRFQTLTNVLIGVGIADFIHNLLEGANTLKDLADGLGVAIPRLMEMRVAAISSGSSLEGMSKMLAKVEQNASDAADGNLKMRDTFAKIGISLRDLQTLSPDQLFLKTADGLSRVTNEGDKTRIKLELMGKGAFSFDPASYVKKITEIFGTMDRYAESQKRAADISETLKLKTELVRTAFLELLNPILKIGESSGSMADQMAKAQVIAGILGASLLAIVAGSVVNGVKAVAGAFATLTGMLGLSATATSAETAATVASTAAITSNAVARAAGAAAKVASLEASLAQAQAEIANAGALGVSAGVTSSANRATWLLVSARANLAEATAAAALTQGALNSAQASGTVAANGLTAASGGLATVLGTIARVAVLAGVAIAALWPKDANAGEAEEIKRIQNLQDALAGMTKEQLDNYNKLSDAEKKRVNDQLIFASESKKQQEVMDKILGKKSGTGTVGAINNDAVNAINARIEAIQSETENINGNNQRVLDRIKLEGQLANVSQATREAALAGFDAETKYLNEIDRINKQIASTRAEMIKANNTTEKDGLQKVIEAYEKQKEAIKNVSKDTEELKRKQAEAARTFEAGWNKAFREYRDQATNAALQAERVFGKLTQGLEDAFVNFAKTGKFAFKDLIASITEELLRSQIRQLLGNIFSPVGGNTGGGNLLGSIWGGVKSIFGFASGGGVGQNTPVLVGERGPEIFLPGGNGTIVPNNQLGQTASVTYNINAVDAASFKSMIARDPQFLYAITEQGRKTIPGAR